MTTFRIGEVAELMGVSTDTVRRWVDAGRLPAVRDEQARRVVRGTDLAAFARSLHEARTSAAGAEAERAGVSSARNRFPGIVTEVVRDSVMAKVEIQAGPHRVVALMSREAADELGLDVGSVAVAVVKSTNVVVEVVRSS
jgi:molybdopterin-binding protein